MARNKKVKKIEKELERWVICQHKKYMKIIKKNEKELNYIG